MNWEETAQAISRWFWRKTQHVTVGGTDASAGVPAVLDAGGKWDASLIDDSDIDHGSLGGLTDVVDHPDYLLKDGTRPLTADWDAGSFEIRAQTLEADVVTGTAPLTIASTTKVTNLNSDLLDDQSGAYYLDSANFTGTNWTDLTDGGNTTLHIHDSRYYTESEHISTSAGAADAGKPIVLDAAGHVDATMVNDADIDHTAIANIGTNSHATIDTHIAATAAHGATGAVVGTTNTQTLTNKTLTTPTISATGFANANHAHTGSTSGGQLDHTTALTNVGTNSHATIDTHIAATAAHGATGAVVGTTNTQTLSNKSHDGNMYFGDNVDGSGSPLTVGNLTGGAGSTNETARLAFNLSDDGSTKRVGGVIYAGKDADYTTAANRDSFLSLNVAVDATNTEIMRLNQSGVGVNATPSTAQLEVIASAASKVGLIVNSAASPSTDIVQFLDNSVTKAALTKEGWWKIVEEDATVPGSTGATIILQTTDASPAALDMCGTIRGMAEDSAGNDTVFVDLYLQADVVTNGSERGGFYVQTQHSNDDAIPFAAVGSNVRMCSSSLSSVNFQGGDGIIFIENVTTTPSANPSGGGFLYAEAGALKWRGSSGTITTIAVA